ncbi:MAG: nuclear transport factor 2 family protein [Dehalococcoidia bacterium]
MAEVPAAIQHFLEGIQTGNWDGVEDCFTPDAVYDASVPGWHYQYQGAARIAQELREEWTGKHPWWLVEINVVLTPVGAVVDFEARGRCPGDERHAPHEEGIRLANIFRLEGGRIAEHRFYCCGEWDEETLRRIEAEAPNVRRAAAVG